MKPEERHELKENSLMIWLQYKLPAFLKKNGSYLILAATLCLLGYTLWNKRQQGIEATHSKFAEELVNAQPGARNRLLKLQHLVNDCDVPAICAIALRDLGNYYLTAVNTGVVEATTSSSSSTTAPAAMIRIDPEEAMTRAAEAFNRILKNYPDNILAVGSAKMGLAAIAENKRNWDEARRIYQELVAPGARTGMTFAAAANAHLESLSALAKAPQLAINIPTTLPATTMPSSFLNELHVAPPTDSPPASLPVNGQ
ncbi:MAG: hypothetical protein FWD61_11515 [Phycisphaerales bacterium]|nr:hypothetical protein [Phycisphaerales bacterium]